MSDSGQDWPNDQGQGADGAGSSAGGSAPPSGGSGSPPPSGGGSSPPPPPSSGGGAPPPPPQGQSQPQQSGVGQPADLGVRFGAKVIDWIILMVVYFVVFVPIFFLALFSDASATGGFGFGFSAGGFVVSVLFAAVTVGYFAWMEANRGQTFGKMVLNLRVVGPGGGNPTMEQGVKRNAWMALGIVPILGGLAQLAAAIYIAVTINGSATKQGWHDVFGDGTQVVKTS